MTDLVPVRHNDANTLAVAEETWKLANRMAGTEFVPKGLRSAESVLGAMLTGHELGIQPMASLAKIHVIEGRPTLSAEMMRAIVLREGHQIHVEETTNTRCTLVGRRGGDTRETSITWTMDDARNAGLVNKNNWKSYPRAMLLARATGELVRAVFPDVLAGISYAKEEAEDGLDDFEGTAVPETPAAPAGRVAKAAKKVTKKAGGKRKAAAPKAAEPTQEAAEMPPLPDEPIPDDDEIVDAEIIEDDAQGDEAQGARLSGPAVIAMKFKEHGIEDRDMKLAVTGAIIGREIESTKDLTPAEMAQVVAAVNAEDFDPVTLMATAAPPPANPPDDVDPGSGDVESWGEGGWRRWLREHKIPVTRALTVAAEVARDNLDAEPPKSLAKLADWYDAVAVRDALVAGVGS